MKHSCLFNGDNMPEFMKNKKFNIPHNRPTIGAEEINAVTEALSNLELTLGTKVKKFESDFSKFIGLPSVSSSSGTAALQLALAVVGVSKNDKVLLPAYTCISVALPILYQRAKPILVDVNYDYNISVDDLRKKISPEIKALIVPHMFGYPARINEIKEICDEYNIYLIEDCAQSIGAECDGEKVGTFGDIAIFSFYATKMMTSIQGGMISTRNPEWLKEITELRFHDQHRSLEDDMDKRIKYNYMMSDIDAAVGIEQLKKLEKFIKRRREIATIYKKELGDVRLIHPIEEKGKKHVYSRYLIRSDNNPVDVIQALREHNITCEMMHVPPLHKRALIKEFNKNEQFHNTDQIVKTSISLPIYHSMSNEELYYVIDKINKCMNL